MKNSSGRARINRNREEFSVMGKKREMRSAANEGVHIFQTPFLRKSQFLPYRIVNSGN